MSIAGFDMIWSVTQNTINSQFLWLQEEGLIASSLAFGDLTMTGSLSAARVRTPRCWPRPPSLSTPVNPTSCE
jgi:hypothetical protein